MVMYDNEFKTKENIIWTKDKIEPQHGHLLFTDSLLCSLGNNAFTFFL